MKRVLLLAVFSLVLFTGCRGLGGGVYIDSGYYGHNAPPAHAPAHGRRHHRYHYYPNAEFYFDVGRNMYFYLDSHAQWSFSVNLPIHLRSHLHNNYVEIEMEDDRPYRRHKFYKSKYKKHKTRYKRKQTRSNRDNNVKQQRSEQRYNNVKQQRYNNKQENTKSYKTKKNRKYKDEDDGDYRKGKKGNKH